MGDYRKALKQSFPSQMLTLVIILLLAGILRWTFSQGMGGKDEILYANSARLLTQGTVTLAPVEGAGRIGMYGPLALLYLLFGPSIATTMAWPFLCSLITIFLIYKIAQLLGNEKAAIFAALFWALFPLSIVTATSNVPDTTMAMVSAAAIYSWLLANRKTGWAAAAYYLGSAFFLFWGLWTKQQIVITAGFLFLWSIARPLSSTIAVIYKRIKQKPRIAFAMGALLFGLFIYFYGSIQQVSFPDLLAVTSQDIFSQISTQPLIYFLFPLLVAVFTILMKSNERSDRFVAAWFAFTFLALEWVPMSLNPTVYTPGAIRPISDRTLLFLMLPFAVMTGLVLGKIADAKSMGRTVFLVSPAIAVIVLLSQAEWTDKALVLGISSVAIFLLAILSLSLPFIQSTASSRGFIPLFFLILGISIINPLQKGVDYRYGTTAFFNNLESTAELLASTSNLPIYFYQDEDRRSLNYLNFVSGYQLAPDPFDELSGRMKLFADPANIRESSLVVVLDTSFLNQVSATWWEIAHFTQPRTLFVTNPPQVHVYQVLSREDALARLHNAQRTVLESPTPGANLDLFAAAINANDAETALASYVQLLALDNSASQYEDELIKLIYYDYATLSEGKGSLIDGSFGSNAQNWDRSEADANGLDLNFINDGTTQSVHIANDSKNEIIPLSQHIMLKPNTAYAFQAIIRSTAPVAPLYWWNDGTENYYKEGMPASEQFTSLKFIFITPSWDRPQLVLLAPVVLQGKGEVWIRDVSLIELVGAEP